ARRSLDVGILDTDDERTALPARHQPVEECRTRVVHVQLAGSTWSESQSHRRLNKATAWTAIDSPAPIESTPSLVFPFTLTCDASQPSAPATLPRIASLCGASFGFWAMTTTSTLTIA